MEAEAFLCLICTWSRVLTLWVLWVLAGDRMEGEGLGGGGLLTRRGDRRARWRGRRRLRRLEHCPRVGEGGGWVWRTW